MRFWLSFLVAGFLAGVSVVCPAQASTAGKTLIEKPTIDRIDPPNWWAAMPSPMLLVHGSGLAHAHFAVTGSGVTLTRTQPSANGHWAFLWLDTKSAAPQTLEITARDGQREAHQAYSLAERSHDPRAHAGFSSSDALYLIMTDRFAQGRSDSDPAGDDRSAPRGWHGGNLAGIEQHLDYLQRLGVTALWTTPIASNGAMPEAYHGYAATDLYKVDPHFGTLAEYQQLSAALHARGMKLVIDLVPNHIGVEHPWVSDPPAPDWLHGTLAQHLQAAHNFKELLDPKAPRASWIDITSGWFTNAMPDLNQENPLVARYLIQNALWWVETANLDGIRLDTFPYVDRAFWHDFDATLHSVYPHLTTVGEVFDADPKITSFFAGDVKRTGADGSFDTDLYTPFDFPVYFALRDVLAKGKPMTELNKVLSQDVLYPHPERLVTFIGNHDTPRFFTEDGGDATRLKLALGLLATLRGMPMIYSGDEIGMHGGADPDNRHDFPGGFPGDAHTAFTEAGRTATQEELFRWTSRLLAYRANHAELTMGIEQNLHADADTFAFVRAMNTNGCAQRGSEERLLIVVNKAAESRVVTLPERDTAIAGCTRFDAAAAATGPVPQLANGTVRITEPAESMTVYAVR